MSNWLDLKSGGFSPELNPLWLSCSPGREAHCSDLYCRQRCKTETWGTLKVLRFRHLVCNILLLLVVIDFDRIDVEVFTDPGKASEQYPGNPGQVVSAEEGVATKYNNNNVTVANVNTWAISPAMNMWVVLINGGQQRASIYWQLTYQKRMHNGHQTC